VTIAICGVVHVVAPDYPGYGSSDAPSTTQFMYTVRPAWPMLLSGSRGNSVLCDIAFICRTSVGRWGFGWCHGIRNGWKLWIVQNAVAHAAGLFDAFAQSAHDIVISSTRNYRSDLPLITILSWISFRPNHKDDPKDTLAIFFEREARDQKCHTDELNAGWSVRSHAMGALFTICLNAEPAEPAHWGCTIC